MAMVNQILDNKSRYIEKEKKRQRWSNEIRIDSHRMIFLEI